MSCKHALLSILVLGATLQSCWSWSALSPKQTSTTRLFSATTGSSASGVVTVEQAKTDLVRACGRSATKEEIKRLVNQLDQSAEQAGVGQASSSSGLLAGDWELIYSADETTRSSPFFWAFRQAFPDSADQIFGITDAIPAPIKEVGPAYQMIEWNDSTQSGRFTSRVKVATLGGVATSMMTTKAAIVGSVGLDGVKLKIETTKPEESTVLSMLGPLGQAINENSPPFPSGEALERASPGSSEVVLRTIFCDEGLRVSHDDRRPDDLLVWKRRRFSDYDVL